MDQNISVSTTILENMCPPLFVSCWLLTATTVAHTHGTAVCSNGHKCLMVSLAFHNQLKDIAIEMDLPQNALMVVLVYTVHA